MQTHLNWKKEFFSKTSNIYQNNQQIGKLDHSPFSQSSSGEINGREYTFKSKGIFNEGITIIDTLEDEVIGKISYSNLRKEASIVIDKKASIWKYENLLSTRWSITNSEGLDIKYSG